MKGECGVAGKPDGPTVNCGDGPTFQPCTFEAPFIEPPIEGADELLGCKLLRDPYS